MAGKSMFSKTMRIDLIPDVDTDPVAARKERVVISRPGRTRRQEPPSERGESNHYHALLESIYDAAIITDLTGRIVDVNVRAVEFFLFGREELLGMFVSDVISGADSHSLIDTVIRNLESDRFTLIQAYCVRKNSTYFPAEISVNKLALAETRLCFFVRDITLRRKAEEMLRTEHNAIQNAGNGIASSCRQPP
jgi:PAS domain S-box-containing protein